MSESHLFSKLQIRGIAFRNRIAVSPMCEYSSDDGFANDWHFVHLGSRAVGGAGIVFTEAAAVEPRGRISPNDLGIWKDEHIDTLARITSFIRKHGAAPGMQAWAICMHGAAPGMQIAHAGRKASTRVPWEGGAAVPREEGGWQPVAPSPIPFRDADPVPAELTASEIKTIVEAFAQSTRRAVDAGFQVLEIHGAHGYLIHEFLSPLSNHRHDDYGGSFDNRIRMPLEVATAVRNAWPEHLPLFMRISAIDWVPDGWDLDQSVALAAKLKQLGVDLIDCSSGGLVPYAKIELRPGYQVPFAERIRRETGILTGAVGLITEPEQADALIRAGQADVVLLARELLRRPYWPLHAARALGHHADVPVQYSRAFPRD